MLIGEAFLSRVCRAYPPGLGNPGYQWGTGPAIFLG
jgi:hypothetical protein